MKKKIPTYSIDKFSVEPGLDPFQITFFDSNRTVNVEYPHRHENFYEIFLIINGSGINKIDFNKYEIKPGAVFFVSPGQVHDIEYTPDTEGLLFLFSADFYLLNKPDKNKLYDFPFFYSINENQSAIYLDADQLDDFASLFLKAQSEWHHKKPLFREIVLSYLDIILSYSKRAFPQAEFTKASKGVLLVKKFKQLIDEHYLQNYSVKDFAQILLVTPNHLNETVKQLTGKNASSLIDEKMVLEIKRKLIYTSLNITQIANEFNFADQSYFSKFVKRHTGLSPEAVRKQL